MSEGRIRCYCLAQSHKAARDLYMGKGLTCETRRHTSAWRVDVRESKAVRLPGVVRKLPLTGFVELGPCISKGS